MIQIDDDLFYSLFMWALNVHWYVIIMMHLKLFGVYSTMSKHWESWIKRWNNLSPKGKMMMISI